MKIRRTGKDSPETRDSTLLDSLIEGINALLRINPESAMRSYGSDSFVLREEGQITYSEEEEVKIAINYPKNRERES